MVEPGPTQALETPPLTRIGEYELLRLISVGQTSEVYEARRVGPRGFSRRVALKRVLPQLASDLRFVRTFCDEARVHAGLDHPNLVAVLDFGEQGGELYMAMEYVEGTTLAQLMGISGQRRALPLGPSLRIAREILLGLSHVHAATDSSGVPLGLVHRHVAPSNVLLGTSGEVKLTDFGVVRSAGAETRTLPGELRGKLGYVSPEQAMGARVDARSDLFSVGVLLAEMLLGEPLFSGKTELEVLTQLHTGDLRALETFGQHLPSAVHASLRRLLAQRPMERVLDANEALAEVDRLVNSFGAFAGQAELAELFASHDGPTVSATRIRAEPIGSDFEVQVSYRVRRPGGTIIGPLSLAHLLEMVATARAGLDSEVSRNGGPFMPVSATAEIGRIAARSAYRFFDPVALIASERHPLSVGIAARQLLILVRQRRSGLICVRNSTVQRRFYFVEGSLVATSSTEPEELLGKLISERRSIPTKVVERAIEQGFRNGQALGPALVEAGLLDHDEVQAIARLQSIRRIARALSQTEGELFLIDDARAGETERAIDPRESMRRIVEGIRQGTTQEQLSQAVLPAGGEVLTLCSNHRELCLDLGLSAQEVEILERIGAIGLVDPILSLVRPSEQVTTMRAIFIGLVAGVLRRKRTPSRPGT